MGLSGVLGRFKTGTYTVTRQAAGARVNGLWVPGAPSTFPIDAAVQPLNGKEMQLLPEGYHAEHVQKLYTPTLLRTVDAEVGTGADSVSIDGDDCKVVATTYAGRATSRGGGGFYKVIVARAVP